MFRITQSPLSRHGLGLGLGLLCSLAWLPSTGHAQMKPGLWEARVMGNTVNGQDNSGRMAEAQKKMEAALAKMTPEQRKQMEQMMGVQAGAAGNPGAVRVCISAAMASRQEMPPDPDTRCRQQNFSRSGNTVEFEYVCERPEGNTRGKGRTTFEGDLIRTRMEVSGERRGRPLNMVMDTEHRYIGPDCGNVKPADEAARK